MQPDDSNGDARLPLAGIRVLECANYVTGPYAGALLADMGADVVKVEPREEGDPFRSWTQGGYSPNFRSLNRSKRSLAVDLRTDDGRVIFRRLLESADVLIQNFRVGAAERLGFGYEDVHALNPRLVYCSISGFGSDGPYRSRPGYDTVGQAMSGLLGLLTDLKDPQTMGVSFSDHLTGMVACYGILAALVGRSITGQGQKVETSLLQATTTFLAENAARYLEDGTVPTRETRVHLAQAYAFVAGDEKPFVVHLSSPPKFWLGLTQAVGRVDLREDPRFVDRSARIAHYDDLHTIFQEMFRTAPRAHWLEALAAADVPAAPLNTFDEVFEDEQVQFLGLVREVTHPEKGPMRLLGSGINLSSVKQLPLRAPPTLGEHSAAILHDLGYSAEDVAHLRAQNVIA